LLEARDASLRYDRILGYQAVDYHSYPQKQEEEGMKIESCTASYNHCAASERGAPFCAEMISLEGAQDIRTVLYS
jgi:hypothetical protein